MKGLNVKRLCGIMYRHGHHMKWVTEVGFPVFQHKVQEARLQINTRSTTNRRR